MAKLVTYKKGGTGAERFAIALILLCAVATPLVKAAESPNLLLPEVDTDSLTNGYSEVARSAMEEGVAMALAEKFGLQAENITARVTKMDQQTLKVHNVKITLRGSAALIRVEEIKKYVGEIFGMDAEGCDVEIEFRG